MNRKVERDGNIRLSFAKADAKAAYLPSVLAGRRFRSSIIMHGQASSIDVGSYKVSYFEWLETSKPIAAVALRDDRNRRDRYPVNDN